MPQRGEFRGGGLQDLGESYQGLRLDPLSPVTGRLRLTYQPAVENLFLAALLAALLTSPAAAQETLNTEIDFPPESPQLRASSGRPCSAKRLCTAR